MSEAIVQTENLPPNPDRRLHPRRQVRSLAYISLGEDNGGIVLNISETGLALQAVGPLTEGHLAHLRFQLPQSRSRGETSGQIAWTGESGKEAGLQFVGAPEDVRNLISAWVSSDSPWEPPPENRDASTETHPQLIDASNAPEPATVVPDTAAPALAIEDCTGDASSIREAPPAPSPPPVAVSAPQALAAPVDAAPAGARLWPITIPQPILAPATPVLHEPRDFGGERWGWGPMAGVLSLLAVLSFAAGLATGRGALNHSLKSLESASGGISHTSSGVEPSSASVAPGSSAPAIQDTKAQVPGDPSAQTQSSSSAPQNLILRRPLATSSAHPLGNDAAPLELTLPENPVSATASVAIRSRRSIPVPSDTKPQGSLRGESLQVGRLISRREPVYPQDALQQQIEGTVKLHAIIGADGTVQSVGAVSGPALLVTPAIEAVREWHYEPTIYAGQPIETEEDLAITFRLPH